MKITKDEARKIFEADIKSFKSFDMVNILKNPEFIIRLKRMIKEETEKMQPRFAELKAKKEIEQQQILRDAQGISEVYLWTVNCHENYKSQKDELEKEIKQNIEKALFSDATTIMGKILICAIIYKIRVSKVDESLEKIIPVLNNKIDIFFDLIKKEFVLALEMGEKYTLKYKLSKHYKKALEMILCSLPNTFVEHEFLCEEAIVEYVQKNKSEFVEKIMSKISNESDKDLFNLYFGLTNQPPKTLEEIAEQTNQSIVTITKKFINIAKDLKRSVRWNLN